MLQQAGIKVTNTENGQAALEVFAKSADYTYDAILMDIRMDLDCQLTSASRVVPGKEIYTAYSVESCAIL